MSGSEYIERVALQDLHDAAPAPVRKALGLRLLETGTGLVSIAAGLPASAIVINRALAIGLDSDSPPDEVRAIVAAYREAGVDRFFLQHHPDARPQGLRDWYGEAGLVKARGWQKFSRGPGPTGTSTTDLSVRAATRDDGEEFARIVCDAFDLGDAAIPWLAELPGREGWHIFMSFDGDVAAGTGALFVRDGIGWTDFGATAPAYRRRGSQGAILAQRVRHALDLGCTEICTCTGEAVEGDPQHSYRNIEKAGFRRTYVRENYAPY